MKECYDLIMATGVYVRTEYHKSILKKSLSKAFKISAEKRKGVPLTMEHRKKITAGLEKYKGVPRSKEVALKISKSLTGRKLSLELRNKISLIQKGKKKPPRTKEHRQRNAVHCTGSGSHWWRGGRTALAKQIKNLSDYKEWRRLVFERDNWTCQWCHKHGGIELAPDHIKPFSQILDKNRIASQEQAKTCVELWDISNGRTLCHPCHKTTDTYGWNIYNKKR